MQEDLALQDLPPHNIEAENHVIGSLLIDGESFARVEPTLSAEHFFVEQNRYIYEACHELFMEGVAIDQETLRDQLVTNEKLEAVGGDAQLSALVAAVPHALNIVEYARMVTRTFKLRQLGRAGELIREIGMDYSNSHNVDAALKRAEDIVFKVGQDAEQADFVPIREAPSISQFFAHPFSSGETAGESEPIPTGFETLDGILGGFHRSDMVVLAARPGFGKSTMALNTALTAAKEGLTVGIFSLEMGINQIAHRMAAAHCRLNIQSIRNSTLNNAELDRLSDAYGYLGDLKIFIDDTALQTVSAMRSKARRLKMQSGLDFIIVDYLQLINGSSTVREGNRVQEVSEISRHLKAIARDLNVPVLACSQLSRAVEHRTSREPRLADLRESGAIEQDADVVMFIHRNDKNISEDEWNRRNPTQEYPRGLAEIIIAKHRHGPTATLEMSVRDEWGLFQSIPEATYS